MKKLLAIAFSCAALSLHAEGYQVNSQSAKQSGMAHTGTGLALGAESMHFNPAGLCHLLGPVDVSVGMSGIKSVIKYTAADGYSQTTGNKISTPLYAYAGFGLVKDRLAGGIALTTPYGSGVDWGTDWRGATVVQDISLRAFILQPTLSAVIAPGLTFGAGFMVGTGSFDLAKSLLPVGGLPTAPDMAPVSLRLAGKASTVYGYNLGLLYITPSKKWSFGVSYRSEMTARVDSDDSHLTYANDLTRATLAVAAPTIAAYEGAQFKTELPLPSNLTFGAGYRPSPRLLLALDVQLVGWSAYETLEFDFTGLPRTAGVNPSVTVKDYDNTMIVRLGGQYSLAPAWDVRAGVYYDQKPVPDNLYYPDTPGADKIGLSGGVTFRATRNVAIDAACTYIDGLKVKGATCPAPTSTTPAATFAGDYKCHSWIASLGVSCRF